MIPAEALDDADAAERWLREVEGDRAALEEAVGDAIATANRALYAHAVATQEPGLPQLSRAHVLAARVGFGSGEELADGQWSRAVEVPPPRERQRRTEALRPAERLAAVLGGRERLDVCETMLLRARADLDAGRVREGAIQLGAGLETLLREIGERAGPDQADDLATLSERREATIAAARSAVVGGLDPGAIDELGETLRISERVLRRRRILGA